MFEGLITLKRSHQMGKARGVVSVCSAHPLVLRTAMQMAVSENQPLLIEATANQVNQYGGYSGMTPEQFVSFVHQMARSIELPETRFMIGADHLGPHIWKKEPSETAMEKAEELVRQCVLAGFGKIHLDTTARCLDDPNTLPLEVITKRAARLCDVSEALNSTHLLYVIGNEVPLPGGGLKSDGEIPITDPGQMRFALNQYETAFRSAGLKHAFDRVIAIVVQPGVDFGDRHVGAYNPERAVSLSNAHAELPGMMTYEVHATDYQTPAAIKQMVSDHFSILKTGPCLTFALYRALHALSEIEAALPEIQAPSNLIPTMERLMTAHPEYWENHYRGTAAALKYLRHHSLRDRIRYYWPFPEARAAVEHLLNNLQRPIPLDLLQKYGVAEYLESGPKGEMAPLAVICNAVKSALMPYFKAST